MGKVILEVSLSLFFGDAILDRSRKYWTSDDPHSPPRLQCRGAPACHAAQHPTQLVSVPSSLMVLFVDRIIDMSPASAYFRESISTCEVSFPLVDSTAPGELPITPELVTAFRDSLLTFNISLRFFSGSWETFDIHESLSLPRDRGDGECYLGVLYISQLTTASCLVAANRDRTYDMVLTSETIYRVESLSALIELMQKAVGQHEYHASWPQVLYFGVGGGVSEFVAVLRDVGRVERWENREELEGSYAGAMALGLPVVICF
ncbi:Histidine protein [Salix suchowensis]|nr:Histidine protein [Salix suchowensis]